MKKYLLTLLLILITTLFISCKSDFVEYTIANLDSYDDTLLYYNKLDINCADPTIIYITEGSEAGYFYLYGTSDFTGFYAYRSKDLTNWENTGKALNANTSLSWGKRHYWAPEIIYDSEDNLYYLFYSSNDANSNYLISVAVSRNPYGPFVSINDLDTNETRLKEDNAVLDLTTNNSNIDSSLVRLNSIDVHPFIDPISNKKYLYFSYFDSFTQSEIFGIEMQDWFTPKYDTLTQLTSVGFLTVEDGLNDNIYKRVSEGTINEGPYMYYDSGIYYLTFSVFGYTDEKYQVRQALGDSPLGLFTKLLPEEGGTVIATDPSWTHMASSGHHCFLKVGDELLIFYHTFVNGLTISGGRSIAVNRVEFINYNNQRLLYANGPTKSLQYLPSIVSGYSNLALNATFSASKNNNDTTLLHDNLIRMREVDKVNDFYVEGKNSKSTSLDIKITLSNVSKVKAIIVYNAYSYYDSFGSINRLEFNNHVIKDINYDFNSNSNLEDEMMYPGGAFIIVFDEEVSLNQIKLKIKSYSYSSIAIGEIVILGKGE